MKASKGSSNEAKKASTKKRKGQTGNAGEYNAEIQQIEELND